MTATANSTSAHTPEQAPRALAMIALGSNLGDSASALVHAAERISALPSTQLVAMSPVYETEPAYNTQQDTFYNAVAAVKTGLSPYDLLAELQILELESGRVRSFPNAPRTLDLDILDYQGVVMDDEDLTLPHPRILERDFTVTPLLDLDPSYVLADGTPVTRDRVEYGKIICKIATADTSKLTQNSETASAPDGKRKRGRPKKTAEQRSERKMHIVNAAVRQFSRQSFAETTMSDIARAADLDQSSLYYWFKSKEDILDFILRDAQASMRLAIRVAVRKGNEPLRLYAIVYEDALMMCDLPFDYFELEAAAMANPERLTTFFETYRMLRSATEKIIMQGIQYGSIRSDDPSVSMSVALSLTEGLQHQYHRQQTSKTNPDIAGWITTSFADKHEAARLAANSVISILVDNPDLDQLYKDAVEQNLISSPTS